MELKTKSETFILCLHKADLILSFQDISNFSVLVLKWSVLLLTK